MCRRFKSIPFAYLKSQGLKAKGDSQTSLWGLLEFLSVSQPCWQMYSTLHSGVVKQTLLLLGGFFWLGFFFLDHCCFYLADSADICGSYFRYLFLNVFSPICGNFVKSVLCASLKYNVSFLCYFIHLLKQAKADRSTLNCAQLYLAARDRMIRKG